MLKSTLKLKKDVHIEKYPKLTAFLKKSSTGHKPKKSKIFTAADVEKFLNEAPDSVYLAAKVSYFVFNLYQLYCKLFYKTINVRNFKVYS